MLALGTGNGAVFQLVPQRFGKEIGVMTGLVGSAGGVGVRSRQARRALPPPPPPSAFTRITTSARRRRP
jgi:nitrate/nitrite transporter NarK